MNCNTEFTYGLDIDSESTYTVETDGKQTTVTSYFKGRCRTCWGDLLAKGATGAPENVEEIQCRICGEEAKEAEAGKELEAMWAHALKNEGEMSSNEVYLTNSYPQNAKFCYKVILGRRVRARKEVFEESRLREYEGKSRKIWIGRREYPPGHVGFLFSQAKMFTDSTSRIEQELRKLLSEITPTVEPANNGSQLARVRMNTHHTRAYEECATLLLGHTMNGVHSAAFACELAMKAISLTSCGWASKTHNLAKLYDELPEGSKERVTRDWTEIATALKEGQEKFGKDRYFEVRRGEETVTSALEIQTVQGLCKAARVLLDECVVVGLGFELKLKVNRKGQPRRSTAIVDLGDEPPGSRESTRRVDAAKGRRERIVAS